jgi:hypothetical protein
VLNAVITGVAIGLAGHFLLGKPLKTYLFRASPVATLVIASIVALLFMLAGAMAFAEFISRAFGFSPSSAYAIMISGIFSFPTVFIVILMLQGGAETLQKYAMDALGPFVSLIIAFLLSEGLATNSGNAFLEREFQIEFAMLNFFLDHWRGLLSGGIAFTVQSFMARVTTAR